MVPTIQRLVDSGIPVMGHIGLTPQAVNQLGGFAIQGRQAQDAKRIIEEAKAIEKAGAFSIVLEGIPGSWQNLLQKTSPSPQWALALAPTVADRF